MFGFEEVVRDARIERPHPSLLVMGYVLRNEPFWQAGSTIDGSGCSQSQHARHDPRDFEKVSQKSTLGTDPP